MADCDFCNREIDGLPFKCRFCGNTFCSKHYLPEDHNCVGLNSFEENKKRWEEILKSELEPKTHKFPKIKEHKPYIPYKKVKSKPKKESKNSKYGKEYSNVVKIINLSRKESHKKKKRLNFLRILKRYWFLIPIFLILIIYLTGFYAKFIDTCEDGTWYKRCSEEKPYFCLDGDLIKNSSQCGCPLGYQSEWDTCFEIPKCEDGTVYSECSAVKPLYCSSGTLIEKASLCGCPSGDYIKSGEQCISKYQTNPKTVKLNYILDGKKETLNYEVYGGMNNYLASLSRSISYYYSEPTTKDFIMKSLDEKNQKELLLPLVNEIRQVTSNKDDQARIAISIVQNIPYDWGGAYFDDLTGKYPYEVIYDMEGVCGEKSELLAFLLRELGFGVSTFEFNLQSHRAVGIKCPSQYDYKDSGYCFIEATTPSIITDDTGDYVGVGKLKSPDEIIMVSGGYSFDSVLEEYNDVLKWISLNEISEANGGYLSSSQYDLWWKIVRKYGIELEEDFDYEKDSYYNIEFEEDFDYETGVPEIDFPFEVESDEPYCPPLTKAELLDCHSISRDPRCPKTQTELRC